MVLEIIGFPQTLEQWIEVQNVVWAGHPALPPNWVRIWSRSAGKEYYRLQPREGCLSTLSAVMHLVCWCVFV